MPKIIDITGQTFGRLTVISTAQRVDGKVAWKCECECGTECIKKGMNLRAGKTKSCGCLKIDVSGARFRTHGLTDSPEYKVWAVAKERCYRVNNPKYKSYGARGIAMCDRWRYSFSNFIEDMGKRPPPHPINGPYSIERTDNDGDYCPENCKWATIIEQANNTRTNRFITYKNETLTLQQWSRRTGIIRETIAARLNAGWSVHHALFKMP